MSGRKLDAPLAVQMASLKKTMQNRDRRRNTDRAQRVVCNCRSMLQPLQLCCLKIDLSPQREADDGAAPDFPQRRKAGSHLLPNATGGLQLAHASAPSGAAAGMIEARVRRCILCQVFDFDHLLASPL